MRRVFPDVYGCLKLYAVHKFQFSSLIAGESDELEHPVRREQPFMFIVLAQSSIHCVGIMKKMQLNLRIEEGRLMKLKRYADTRKKTMTQLIEDWIDSIKEEKPS
jgi:hypothetical protein